jgi:hypothetical protein
LIDGFALTDKSPIKSTKSPEVFVVFVFDELKNYLIVGLNLQHLEYKAEELTWSSIPTVSATNVFKLYSSVNQGLCSQGKAFLFEVRVIVNFESHNLVYQKLWVGSVNLVRSRVSTVRHLNNIIIINE